MPDPSPGDRLEVLIHGLDEQGRGLGCCGAESESPDPPWARPGRVGPGPHEEGDRGSPPPAARAAGVATGEPGSLGEGARAWTTWVVPGAFPGERVLVEVLALSRHAPRGFARVVTVLAGAPGRREAPCPRHVGRGGACTGCPLMELDEDAQREAKRARLARLGIVVPPLDGSGPALGYRWSSKRTAFAGPGDDASRAARSAGTQDGTGARAAPSKGTRDDGGARAARSVDEGAARGGVRAADGPRSLFLGSHRQGSHAGADMGGCLVDHPLIAAAADALAREAAALGVAPYDEATGEGDLRHVWLRTDGEGVLVTLVTAREESRAACELPERLMAPDDPGSPAATSGASGRPSSPAATAAVVGVAHSVHAGAGNAQRGGAPRVLRGRSSLAVEAGGEHAEVGFLSFLQPNPAVAARAYRDLVSTPEGEPAVGDLALDLYAGAGATTALLRRRFAQVLPCESFPESAAALGVAPETTEAFLAALLADAAHPARRAGLVTANPPRAGLGVAVCRALIALAFPRLTLMSCGPEALARDLALLEAGGYRRLSARAWDTLPQTAHVEVVVWLAWAGTASRHGR